MANAITSFVLTDNTENVTIHSLSGPGPFYYGQEVAFTFRRGQSSHDPVTVLLNGEPINPAYIHMVNSTMYILNLTLDSTFLKSNMLKCYWIKDGIKVEANFSFEISCKYWTLVYVIMHIPYYFCGCGMHVHLKL